MENLDNDLSKIKISYSINIILIKLLNYSYKKLNNQSNKDQFKEWFNLIKDLAKSCKISMNIFNGLNSDIRNHMNPQNLFLRKIIIETTSSELQNEYIKYIKIREIINTIIRCLKFKEDDFDGTYTEDSGYDDVDLTLISIMYDFLKVNYSRNLSLYSNIGSENMSRSQQQASSLQPQASSLQQQASSLQPQASSLQPQASSSQQEASSIQQQALALQLKAISLQKGEMSSEEEDAYLEQRELYLQYQTNFLEKNMLLLKQELIPLKRKTEFLERQVNLLREHSYSQEEERVREEGLEVNLLREQPSSQERVREELQSKNGSAHSSEEAQLGGTLRQKNRKRKSSDN